MSDEHSNPPSDDDKTQIAAPGGAVPAQPEPALTAAPKPVTKAPTADPTAPVPIGTLINNNYEIKQLINAGGMGEVFRGENVFTGDSVAIKIVLQALAHDEKVAALFMREAKVLCQLSHQAIVRYYNFVRDADLDRFCLIMEFIEGVALSDHIRDVAPLTLGQATGLMRRVAAGLDRAHQMDVIHRDLSPDNVMLRDGLVENAVLIDFGIAKSAEMAESTLHGQLAGKFKYISPEQLGHFGGEIGPRTDIYGLGLMMAAALRGTPLDMGSSVVEAVNARREIPDLSDIGPALRPLLAHMLEPDPAHRPARMSDVIALLDNPRTIPSKYGQAAPVAGVGGASAAAVPGLRQPPGRNAAPPSFGVAATPADADSASPFGNAPAPTTTPPSPVSDGKQGGGLLRWLLVLLIFGGIGGFFAWQQGYLDDFAGPVAGPDNGNGTVTPPVAGGLDPSTREGYLAGWSTGACSFATRIKAGPNSGTIAAFSSDATAFDGLAEAYDEEFGARPTVLERPVAGAQCPALALANKMRTAQAAPPVLTLDTDIMESGGAIVGRLSDRRGRPVWLAWVSNQGGVYNLTDRLLEQADGSATFTFGLTAEDDADPTPQLLIAVVTDTPLIAAAAASDGTLAASLMPLIEAEIAGRDDDRAGVAVIGFSLSP
ncbi:serine/threonine-protein kinase [Yoonia sp. SS1-5]|uniref:Serine/threonine-protein kinase n=1 Tax=Yoonia rhodophyticola TaxID=3137370 RepID=A0AAN0NL05_9RHOB